MNYTTSATEENPLSEETISITCSSGEFRLTECLRSPQNRRGCYDERFDQYVYSNVTCKRGKSSQMFVMIAIKFNKTS